MQSVTSNAVAEALEISIQDGIQNMSVYKYWGILSDFETKEVNVEEGVTYLFINTHVYRREFTLFSVYNSVNSNALLPSYTAIEYVSSGKIRLRAPAECRGYIFKFADTVGA